MLKSERVTQQDVVFPQSRPWNKDQEKTDLEAEQDEGNGKKTIHEC